MAFPTRRRRKRWGTGHRLLSLVLNLRTAWWLGRRLLRHRVLMGRRLLRYRLLR